ncbi:MAG: histidine--tRNA ligase [Proteobacteria bacterium]|nr:histidine--tRNA ligase [Pseudomonadota bacterium]
MGTAITLQPPRGTHDALPDLSRRFRFVEETVLKVFKTYGFGEIRTPMFEATDVFARNVGDTTDIVTKEMYTFTDRGGDNLSLRPEGTAPVVRAYYSNGLKQHLPLKLCYVGTPMFRYERPQKGRLREHHQVGAEVFGIAGPMAEVELIAMAFDFLRALGMKEDFYVQLNSLGTSEERSKYRDALVAYFTPFKDKLSEESKDRLAKNPLRILDSKDEGDRKLLADAPKLADYLGNESSAHFAAVQKGLDTLDIRWQVNNTLVRGLDYYSHTVFEIHSDALGAQSQVVSGGRYNGLIGQMGGDDVPAVGFGCGVERLELMLAADAVPENRPVAFVTMNEEATMQSLDLARKLRAGGLEVLVALDPLSVKAQMKRANKVNATHTIVVGEEELASGKFVLKDMDAGTQDSLSPEDIIASLCGGAL